MFVDAWIALVDPDYVSPYANQRRALRTNSTDVETIVQKKNVHDALRNLQARDSLRQLQASLIETSIQCIEQYDAVSFSVEPEHFPVYVKDSIYNSQSDYDFSVFDKLKNKILLS